MSHTDFSILILIISKIIILDCINCEIGSIYGIQLKVPLIYGINIVGFLISYVYLVFITFYYTD